MQHRVFCALVLLLAGTGSVSGQVIVSDWGGRLQRFDPFGGTVLLNGMQAQPTGMAYGPDGFLYVSDIGSNTVNKYNATTGAFVSTVLSSAQLGSGFQATGLAFGPGGDLLVANQVGIFAPGLGTGSVWRYNLTTTAFTPLLTGLNQPEGLLFFGGNLYVAEVSNIDPTQAKVSKYDFVNPISTYIPHGASLNQPTGMAIGPDGQMYVTDVTGFAVRKFNVSNPNINSTFASGSGFNSPTGLAFFAGHMFVSNYGTGSPDGFLSEFDWTTGAYQANVVTGLIIGSAVVAVPEPASFVLFGLPAGLFVLRRLRRGDKQ
jgi:streptogramin lyase